MSLHTSTQPQVMFPAAMFYNKEFRKTMDNFFYEEMPSNLCKDNDTHDGTLSFDDLTYISFANSGVNPNNAKSTTTTRKKVTVKAAAACSDGLQVYHKAVGGYDPFTPEAELAAFKEYRKLTTQFNVEMRKIPKNSQGVLRTLAKHFTKNYAVILRELTALPPEYSKPLLALVTTRDVLRNEIIMRNLRFVMKVAKGFWKDNDIETYKSLISAGNIGLFTAVDKFDLKRGTRFLSYAANWISLEIRLELANNKLVQVPMWWQKMVAKLASVHKTMHSQQVTTAELAAKAAVSEKYVLHINGNQHIVCPDNLTTSNQLIEIDERGFYVATESSQEDLVTQRDIRDRLQDFLNVLSPKEQGVIRLLFGLSYEDKNLNLRQIGNVYNLSSERIRQIKERALATLRANFEKIGCHSVQDLY